MKKIFLRLALLLAAWNAAGAAETAGPKLASTIDFLDYVFYNAADGSEYYPLEVWEKRIAEMAAGGLDKIYLRVNCCGLTLYPTKVAAMYGDEGGYHWNIPAAEGPDRLIRTLRTYDPLTETIRLGHQYGLEVWCWESLWDDAAGWAFMSENDYPELVAEYGHYPLMDPFFRRNFDGYSKRDPRLTFSPQQVEAINQAARRRPVGRIEITSSVTGRPQPEFSDETLEIWCSGDNREYRPYDGPRQFRTEQTADGRWKLIIDQLELTRPFVKLVPRQAWPQDRFAMVIDQPRTPLGQIFNVDGEAVPAVWGQVLNGGEAAALVFSPFARFAWDYENRQLGFVVGEPEPDEREAYFLGVCEFAEPEVMAHKVARFRELTAYDFDGFLFNLRSHSEVADPAAYGFNAALRDQYLARYGRDIWDEDFDRAALDELRAEALDEFLRRCKAETGGRPLYFTATSNGPEQAGAHYKMVRWAKTLGIPWHFDRWFADGSIDGVMMIGDYFPAELAEAAAGKDIAVGVFREMAFPQKGYDFDADMAELFTDDSIDEIELYETLELTNHPARFEKLKALKQAAGRDGGRTAEK